MTEIVLRHRLQPHMVSRDLVSFREDVNASHITSWLWMEYCAAGITHTPLEIMDFVLRGTSWRLWLKLEFSWIWRILHFVNVTGRFLTRRTRPRKKKASTGDDTIMHSSAKVSVDRHVY